MIQRFNVFGLSFHAIRLPKTGTVKERLPTFVFL